MFGFKLFALRHIFSLHVFFFFFGLKLFYSNKWKKKKTKQVNLADDSHFFFHDYTSHGVAYDKRTVFIQFKKDEKYNCVTFRGATKNAKTKLQIVISGQQFGKAMALT